MNMKCRSDKRLLLLMGGWIDGGAVPCVSTASAYGHPWYAGTPLQLRLRRNAAVTGTERMPQCTAKSFTIDAPGGLHSHTLWVLWPPPFPASRPSSSRRSTNFLCYEDHPASLRWDNDTSAVFEHNYTVISRRCLSVISAVFSGARLHDTVCSVAVIVSCR